MRLILLFFFIVMACTPAKSTPVVDKTAIAGPCSQNEPAHLTTFRTALLNRDYTTLAGSFDPQSTVALTAAEWQQYFDGFDQNGSTFLGLAYAGTCVGGGRTVSFYLQQVHHKDGTSHAEWTEIETSQNGLILDFNQG